MALEIKVHGEIRAYEAKIIGPLSWRQLVCVIVGIPIMVGVSALMWGSSYLIYADLAAFAPFAMWGWWRPKDLRPETYLRAILPALVGSKEYRYEFVPHQGSQEHKALRRSKQHRHARDLEHRRNSR